ncbi:MAG: aldehyde dehydrogenase [Burkholderiaceae bacterium]
MGNEKAIIETSDAIETTDPVQTAGLLLNGVDLPASTGQTFDRSGPLGGQPVTRAAAASTADASRAVDIAAGAFPAWSALDAEHRHQLLIAAGQSLLDHAEHLITAMVQETGATHGWARFNVSLGAQMLVQAATLSSQVGEQLIESNRPGCTAMAVRQPAGVVFSMAPWNAPVILGVRSLAAPLACGNTVVFKSSEMCPQTHRLIVQALLDAGVPGGALNLISSAPAAANAVVEAVIAHPAVRRVNFTGSTRVGRIVAQMAGRYLKPVLLELGGKAPLIVLDDADLKAAVDAACFGAFVNQGQICMSTEKIVVHEKIADEFTAALRDKVLTIVAGDPRNPETTFGCVVDDSAAKRLAGLVDDALAKGAVLEVGGKTDGVFMPATVLSRVTPAMRVYSEESFGPIVSIIRAGGDNEAVRIANDTEYGLTAAVFSRDVDRAMALARRIESGICHINGPTVHDEAQMPFGGVKASGYGRFGGQAAISEFTDLRWITVQDGDIHYPL